MKAKKYFLLALLSLVSFSYTEIFLASLLPANAQQNNISEQNNTDFKCYQQYPESEYPEAKAYCHGLANTKIAKQEQIWKGLTAIEESNDPVLVVTWTTWGGYEENMGKFMENTRDTWVTVAPELQNFCKKYNRNTLVPLPYRINQVLGLTPEKEETYQKRKFAQIWVKPKDLFRPTPDPEITDSEAELGFIPNWFRPISDSYKYWFLNQLMTNNYPWTKLGYTYDWGQHSDWQEIDADRPANVGLSEFIIQEKATIKVHSVSTLENYC
ncbi:MAG: hypothetical protein F6K14_29345 [Symploca sp. SIO2C1]|nr:hypothetical protein [Symploca sp. SIO2C1]